MQIERTGEIEFFLKADHNVRITLKGVDYDLMPDGDGMVSNLVAAGRSLLLELGYRPDMYQPLRTQSRERLTG